MSKNGKHEALEESEREALEGSAMVGAPDAAATTHDASQTAADSTDAVVEAGLKGSGA